MIRLSYNSIIYAYIIQRLTYSDIYFDLTTVVYIVWNITYDDTEILCMFKQLTELSDKIHGYI